MDLENIEPHQLSTNLAELFQQVVEHSKHGLPLFEELSNKSVKLQAQIRTTILVFGSFLDTLQKIADCASQSNSSSKDVGICLTRLVLRQRVLEQNIKTLASSLEGSLLPFLQTKPEEWKKTMSLLDRQHAKELKSLRTTIKQKTEHISKLRKKAKKEPSKQVHKMIEQTHDDVHRKYIIMEEQERKATRAINVEERSHYTMFANCLKPVLEEEWKMGPAFERLHEVAEELQKIVEDPVKVPDTEESLLMNYRPALSTTSSIESLRREGRFRRSSDRSLDSVCSSQASSAESLGEGDYGVNLRLSSTNKDDISPPIKCPEIPTFRHSRVLSQQESNLAPEVLLIRRNSTSSSTSCESPKENPDDPEAVHDMVISADSSFSPSRNDLCDQETSQYVALRRTHKRTPSLHKRPGYSSSSSLINRYGSPQHRYDVLLTDIDESHEYMPQPMQPLENTPPANQEVGSQPYNNGHYEETESIRHMNSESGNQMSSTQPCRTTPRIEQRNIEQMEDDIRSNNSLETSSGYGSTGDENTSNTAKEESVASKSKNALFSTFSNFSTFTKNFNVPMRRHSFKSEEKPSVESNFDRSSWRRSSCYAAPPKIAPKPPNLPQLTAPLFKSRMTSPKQINPPILPQSSISSTPAMMDTSPCETVSSQGPYMSLIPINQSPEPSPCFISLSSLPSQVTSPPTTSFPIDPVTLAPEVFQLSSTPHLPRCLRDEQDMEWPIQDGDQGSDEDFPPPPPPEHPSYNDHDQYSHYQEPQQGHLLNQLHNIVNLLDDI